MRMFTWVEVDAGHCGCDGRRPHFSWAAVLEQVEIFPSDSEEGEAFYEGGGLIPEPAEEEGVLACTRGYEPIDVPQGQEVRQDLPLFHGGERWLTGVPEGGLLIKRG